MLWILIGLVVLILLIDRREHMTNDDLISALKTFGDKAPPKKKKDPTETDNVPIYGPRAPQVTPADPSKTKLSPTVSGVYPDIYGPDITTAPGTKTKPSSKPSSDTPSSKSASDNLDDDTYEFNPDLKKAFPTDGPAQPFLTDFSKLQH
jgi:hypothetical protein